MPAKDWMSVSIYDPDNPEAKSGRLNMSVAMHAFDIFRLRSQRRMQTV